MKILFLFIFTIFILSCGGSPNETDGTQATETSQQVGDIMASVDEVGGATGDISFLENSIKKTFARYAPHEMDENYLAQFFLPRAEAT